MAPLKLEGETLGERHRHYNKLLMKALADNEFGDPEEINYNDNDIDNMMRIDIASHKKDVDYILEVLKSEDLLYVSRALKRSVWLVVEPLYAHIINPQYLSVNLFPYMNPKAITKFMLHIRKHLRDEKRVEEFYLYKKEKDQAAALKWLLNCSLNFKLSIAENNKKIPVHLLKRLYRNDHNFLIKFIERCIEKEKYPYKIGRILAKSHCEIYLNILGYIFTWNATIDDWGSALTKVFIKKCPERIVRSFGHYSTFIHIPTFVKYLQKEIGVEAFLYREAKVNQLWFTFQYLKPFLTVIPRENTTKILKYIFRINDPENKKTLLDIYYDINDHYIQRYVWYQFAPFEEAKDGLQKLIYAENSPDERHVMLSVLLACARQDQYYIHEVLKYYHDRHINEPFKYKIKFIKNLIAQYDTYKLDRSTWDLLNNIFRSMEIYVKLDKPNSKQQICIKAIIVYYLLHNEDIPEIIEDKFEFDTLKLYQNKLNSVDSEKIFLYLYNYVIKKVQNPIRTENELNGMVTLLNNLWQLLKDWKKEQQYHHIVLNKIKELLQLRDQITQVDLSNLYRMLGPWQKQLFEESLLLCAKEDSYVNALKHGPQLLTCNSAELLVYVVADPLRHLLHKLRLYYPDTLAKQWSDEYLAHVKHATTISHRSLVVGLMTLVPSYKLIDFIKHYAPDQSKIQWAEEDENELSLRKYIARTMYLARPPLSTEVVLWYAKGDYLQFAQSSLNAIYCNLKKIQVREHIQKLLSAPVSIQKQGIRLAYKVLDTDEQKSAFCNAWNATRNPSIRTVLFTSTYNLLCKEQDKNQIKELWKLLSAFIDNLIHDDNKIIFDTLGKVEAVPFSVRSEFYMKSYVFLTSVPDKANCEPIVKELTAYAPTLIEYLDSEFVIKVLLDDIYRKFIEKKHDYMRIMCGFLLFSKDENIQNQKYDNILAPVVERSVSKWVEDRDESVNASIELILRLLCYNLPKYAFEKRMAVPHLMFKKMHNILKSKNMPVLKYYMMLTSWKLMVAFVGMLDGLNWNCNDAEDTWNDQSWKKILSKVCPGFGKFCRQLLKEDVNKYFSSIYMLFANALRRLYYYFSIEKEIQVIIIQSLLDNDFVESYLLASTLLPCKNNYYIVEKDILAHTSIEVRMLHNINAK